MKKILLILALVFCTVVSYAQEVTTYYFVRHAEKQRQDPKERDPELMDKGHERAEKWAQIFQDIPLDAVYSTNYRRTKQTAQPTADSKELEVLIYDPRDMFSESFQKETMGKKVLVVGHSNTTPVFVNKILGEEKYSHMDDSDNGSLYTVTIIDGKVTDAVLRMD